MIDREARNRLAEGIRHLVAGLSTNDDFERASLARSADPAIGAVFHGGPWFLYDDLRRYRLRGRDRVHPAVRREAARWVLFLKTDLAYEWPAARLGVVATLAWLLAAVLTLGWSARWRQRRFARHGDISVWSFIRQSDYDAALTRAPYLAAHGECA